MGQWVKALAAEPEDLSSVPGMHTEEGENGLPQAGLHTCALPQ